MGKDYYIGVDIGAGHGAKIGLFRGIQSQVAETFLATQDYGNTAETLTGALTEKIGGILHSEGSSLDGLRSIGIASAGLFKSDGGFLHAANLTYLNGHNLKELLGDRIKVPIGIENDANAGGLAEWSVLRFELVYWALGGGWGGVWIDKDGAVQFPALDWDGNDSHLHYTNEPGYATPLEKARLREIFAESYVSFDRYEAILREDLEEEENVKGPCGNPDFLRAEHLISGPGRWRLFQTVAGEDRSHEALLSAEERKQMRDKTVAGRHISKLCRHGDRTALQTDVLFGKVFAEAVDVIFKQARKDGLPNNIPICIGGKPRDALAFFAPTAQEKMRAKGINSWMRPSVVDERSSNANLLGAAVLAEKVYLTGK